MNQFDRTTLYQHAKFIERVERKGRSIARGSASSLDWLATVMDRWIDSHIEFVDRKMVALIPPELFDTRPLEEMADEVAQIGHL
ncbi:MAG TPA: hypothetical protein HPP80_06615 [Rhodospirillaceae bacterium]|nr:hypothetical protein [Rhodospirillaceae bacterium]